MRRDTRPSLPTVLLRWLLGTALISWRYLWQITPLHRTEQETHGEDPPEAVHGEAVGDASQLLPARDGVGPLFHRRFRVRIADGGLTARELMSTVIHDFGSFVPSEVVGVRQSGSDGDELRVGDEIVVEMPGPWDGPVRVVRTDDDRLRLATLRGHLEAGEIEFRTSDEDGDVIFEVEAWARPSSRTVRLLYTRLRLAKEMQLNMWVRFCLAAAATAGGRVPHGVEIHTNRVVGR